jgi:cytidylate kinase
MATRVVTISHASGAGGDHVGRMVAERLGFRYIDEEVIAVAAEREGIDAEVVADAERRKGLLDRLIADFSITHFAAADGGVFWHPHATAMPRSDDMRVLIIEAIRETAARGNVVIVAHAASIPLAGTKGLLRVLVTASPETRVRRVAESARRPVSEVVKYVSDSDEGRAAYFKRFYQIDEELPTHYDLVVNTDVLTVEDAADLVASAARRRS